MEVVGIIEMWGVSAIDITLAILCFALFRHSGVIKQCSHLKSMDAGR